MLEDDLLVCAADKLVSILLVETGLTTGTDGLEKLDTLVIFTLSAFLLIGLGKELAKLPCHCLNCSNFVHNSSSGFVIVFLLGAFWSAGSRTQAVLVESCATENTDISRGRF